MVVTQSWKIIRLLYAFCILKFQLSVAFYMQTVVTIVAVKYIHKYTLYILVGKYLITLITKLSKHLKIKY